MRERDFLDYMQDITNSIDDINEFIEGLSFEEFEKDNKTTNAVLRT
jgi:uncharacterized protein with HEPN domain